MRASDYGPGYEWTKWWWEDRKRKERNHLKQKARRKRAIAKLTPEQRKELGVK